MKTRNLTRDWARDLLIASQTLLPSEPPDSLMTEECRIVLTSFKSTCFFNKMCDKRKISNVSFNYMYMYI